MSKILRSDRLIHVASGEYPLTLRELGRRHPNITFGVEVNPGFLRILGYEKVVSTPRPDGEYVEELSPKPIDGVWVQQWALREPSEQELQERLSVRKQELLAQLGEKVRQEEAVGFPFEHDGEIYHIQVRTEDRVNILSRVTMADQLKALGQDEEKMFFRPYENTTLWLTPDEMIAMGKQAAVAVETLYQTKWQLEEQINATTSLDRLPELPDTLF